MVEQVELSVVRGEKVLEGPKLLADFECAGKAWLELEVLGPHAREELEGAKH